MIERRLFGLRVVSDGPQMRKGHLYIRLDLKSIRATDHDWPQERQSRLQRRMGLNKTEFRDAIRCIGLMYSHHKVTWRRRPRSSARRVEYASRAQRMAFLEYWMKKAQKRRWYRWEAISFRI